MGSFKEAGARTCGESVEQLEAELLVLRQEMERRERLWKSRLDIAARVHNSLLPKPIDNPRFKFDVRYRPVDTIGGDYCQVLFSNDSQCYVTLCDVVGHGIGPAMLAARVSSHVRQLITQSLQPAQIVAGLNAFVLEHFVGTGLEFLSFFAARVDLDAGLVTYCGAGHPSPVLVPPRDGSIRYLSSQNMLLGVDEGAAENDREETCGISPGDRLVFFTDGVIESTDAGGRMLGVDGLAQMLSRSTATNVSEFADLIDRRLAGFRHGPPRDDMILLVAEITANCEGAAQVETSAEAEQPEC